MIAWMQSAGQQWMTTDHIPQAGSDLALDNASARPAVSDVAAYGVATAIDHFGSVVDVVASDRPIRHFAPFTALRTTLLASARVRWMLEPDKSEDRRLRCLQVCYQNRHEQRKAFNGFLGGHLNAAEKQSISAAITQLDTEIGSLESQAKSLGVQKLAEPKDTVSMLRDLADPNTGWGSAIGGLWRMGSAVAHGYYWAQAGRSDPGKFDEDFFDLSCAGAFVFVTKAQQLYDKRAAAPGA
ncbi:hypothetical protein A5697_06945 [Mycobacterium sp. E3251]|uniref:hypothetical protein n=1 Tax=Mycobacterium sp. E3251 TaxID=1834144 RepID=UPI000801D59E|nr:hypothetical protein [Mycobacterium sp. E3251]OBG92641.1 hypothetical protein A5697_06945 [Mycobacterium sp. E3251]